MRKARERRKFSLLGHICRNLLEKFDLKIVDLIRRKWLIYQTMLLMFRSLLIMIIVRIWPRKWGGRRSANRSRLDHNHFFSSSLNELSRCLSVVFWLKLLTLFSNICPTKRCYKERLVSMKKSLNNYNSSNERYRNDRRSKG